MKIVNSIEDIPPSVSPIALTIGVFDGIHLGHQAIIKDLHKFTRKIGTRALLTFTNHPSHILSSNQPVSLLMSFNHRCHLLKKYGIDLTIALPFTKELSEQSYLDFLCILHNKLPFSELVLGEGAAFGKNQEGDAEHLQALENKIGFKIHYLKKEYHHKEVISSEAIRRLVQDGKLKKIKKKLGRPYSLWYSFDPTRLNRENKALFSFSFEKRDLCMLPTGVYGVDLEWEEETIPGIAFLCGKTDLSGSTLSITVYMEKEPPKSLSLNIAFSEYLYSEIDPTLFSNAPTSMLKNLSAQPSLS